MITLLSLILSLAAAGLVLAGKFQAGWMILAGSGASLFITLQAMRGRKTEYKLQLSEAAVAMLDRHPHYFAMRAASRDMGKAAVLLHLAGVIVAAIGAFKGFYLGILFGAVYFVLLAMLSRGFDPANFSQNAAEKAAIEEIDAAVSAKNAARQRSRKRPASN